MSLRGLKRRVQKTGSVDRFPQFPRASMTRFCTAKTVELDFKRNLYKIKGVPRLWDYLYLVI